MKKLTKKELICEITPEGRCKKCLEIFMSSKDWRDYELKKQREQILEMLKSNKTKEEIIKEIDKSNDEM